MRKQIYQTQITKNSKYSKISEAQEYFRCGRRTLVKIAEECGALIKIGRVHLIDIEKLSNYLEKEYAGV